jgi:hypothetical protein
MVTAGAVIREAIEGKYKRFDEAVFDVILSEAWTVARQCPDEASLLAQLHMIGGLLDDVVNHVVVLHLIDRFWSNALLSRPIARLHRAIMNAPDPTTSKRNTRAIADFGGEIPTELTNIDGAINELELMMERFVPVFRGRDEMAQAVFLSHLFSSIVRIHPFQDGNGRTARLAVQYCVRAWGRGFVPLPKIRNSETWRTALEEAVAGDIGLLAGEFAARLEQSKS